MGSLLDEGFFGFGDQGFDGGFISDGEVGEDFAVDFDAGGLEAFHKSAVGETMSTSGGVDALDPQVAEGAFPDFTVAVVVDHGFPHGVFGVAEVGGTEAAESFGFIDGALAALATGW